MSKFYEDLIGSTLTEKTASTNKNKTIEALKGLSDEAIDALSQEIGIISKIAEETIEEKATEAAREAEGASEKKLKDSSNKSTTDGVKLEDKQIDESNEEAKKETDKEDKVVEKNKDEVDLKESQKEDSEYEVGKSASEILYEFLKEAAEDETEEGKERLEEGIVILKDAYAAAEEMLKNADYTPADYTYTVIGDEKIALDITETAEKLAALSEKPILQVIDDIIAAMIEE